MSTLIITEKRGGGLFGEEYEEVVNVSPFHLPEEYLSLIQVGECGKYLVSDEYQVDDKVPIGGPNAA